MHSDFGEYDSTFEPEKEEMKKKKIRKMKKDMENEIPVSAVAYDSLELHFDELHASPKKKKKKTEKDLGNEMTHSADTHNSRTSLELLSNELHTSPKKKKKKKKKHMEKDMGNEMTVSADVFNSRTSLELLSGEFHTSPKKKKEKKKRIEKGMGNEMTVPVNADDSRNSLELLSDELYISPEKKKKKKRQMEKDMGNEMTVPANADDSRNSLELLSDELYISPEKKKKKKRQMEKDMGNEMTVPANADDSRNSLELLSDELYTFPEKKKKKKRQMEKDMGNEMTVSADVFNSRTSSELLSGEFHTSPKKKKKEKKKQIEKGMGNEMIVPVNADDSRNSLELLSDELYISPEKKKKKKRQMEKDMGNEMTVPANADDSRNSLELLSDELYTSPKKKKQKHMEKDMGNRITVSANADDYRSSLDIHLSPKKKGRKDRGNEAFVFADALGSCHSPKKAENDTGSEILVSADAESSMCVLEPTDEIHTSSSDLLSHDLPTSSKEKSRKDTEHKHTVSANTGDSEFLSGDIHNSPKKKKKKRERDMDQETPSHTTLFYESNGKRKQKEGEKTETTTPVTGFALYSHTSELPEDMMTDKDSEYKTNILEVPGSEALSESPSHGLYETVETDSEDSFAEQMVQENGTDRENETRQMDGQTDLDTNGGPLSDRTQTKDRCPASSPEGRDRWKHRGVVLDEVYENAKPCYICQEDMANKRMYLQHLADEHNKRCFQCPKCMRPLSSEELVEHHLNTCCVYKGSAEFVLSPYHCKRCPMSYAYESGLHRHNNRVHGVGRIKHHKCNHCHKEFSSAERAIQHQVKCQEGLIKKPASEQTFMCQLCGKMYSSKQGRSYHIRTIHQGHVFACVCGKEFRGSRYLYAHKMVCEKV